MWLDKLSVLHSILQLNFSIDYNCFETVNLCRGDLYMRQIKMVRKKFVTISLTL